MLVYNYIKAQLEPHIDCTVKIDRSKEYSSIEEITEEIEKFVDDKYSQYTELALEFKNTKVSSEGIKVPISVPMDRSVFTYVGDITYLFNGSYKINVRSRPGRLDHPHISYGKYCFGDVAFIATELYNENLLEFHDFLLHNMQYGYHPEGAYSKFLYRCYNCLKYTLPKVTCCDKPWV